MKKIYYNKLIRDRIPEKILKKGSKLKTRVLGRAAFERELRLKVVEEAGGVAAAASKKELLDELADLQTVVDALKRLKKITASEARAGYVKNLRAKGKFKKRLYLVWSSDDGYRTNEGRGRKR
mgnify:FL=1